MHFHWSYAGCTKAEEEEILRQWDSRQREIESKAGLAGSSDSSQARVHVEHADASGPWRIQAAIYTPEQTFVAAGQGLEIPAALDHLTEQLSQQIDERSDQQPASEQRSRQLQGVVPFLTDFYRRGHSRGFLFFLIPVMYSYRGYIARELRVRKELNEVTAEEVTARDVMDESLLRAWEEFPQREQSRSFQGWLLQIMDAVFEQYAHPLAEGSLNDRRSFPDLENREALLNEWTEWPTEPESIAWVELLAEEPGIESWDRLSVEDKQTRLHEIFQRLPRQQRQVLMLAAERGFNLQEIADFQNRDAQQVESDLVAAQAIVQRMLSADDLTDIQEQIEQEGLQRPRR